MWILPGAWTGAARAVCAGLIGAYAGDPAVRVIRSDLLLAQATHTDDNNHLNERGNLVVRDALLAAMTEVYGSAAVGYRDRRPATPVPMAGTAGAVAPAAGQVPDGWGGSQCRRRHRGVRLRQRGRPGRGGDPDHRQHHRDDRLAAAAERAGVRVCGRGLHRRLFSGRQVSGGSGGSRSHLPVAAGGGRRSLEEPRPRGLALAGLQPAGRRRRRGASRGGGALPGGGVSDGAGLGRGGVEAAVPAFAPVADRGAVPAIGNPRSAGVRGDVSGGIWFGKPNAVTLGYQWRVDGADVVGATGGLDALGGARGEASAAG